MVLICDIEGEQVDQSNNNFYPSINIVDKPIHQIEYFKDNVDSDNDYDTILSSDNDSEDIIINDDKNDISSDYENMQDKMSRFLDRKDKKISKPPQKKESDESEESSLEDTDEVKIDQSESSDEESDESSESNKKDQSESSIIDVDKSGSSLFKINIDDEFNDLKRLELKTKSKKLSRRNSKKI